MSDLPKSVERIVVEALAAQDAFSRNQQSIHITPESASLLRMGHTFAEPNSGEVTREIFEVFADGMETTESDDVGPFRNMSAVADWLRSQAQENNKP